MECPMLPQLKLDESSAAGLLTAFLKEEAGKAAFSRAVIGLSGGVDSALSASLAARAFGPENVLCVLMPYRSSSADSVEHASLLVHALGVRSELVDISAMVDAVIATDADMDRMRRGNIMARQRMIVLYDRSARERALVIGTGNKTEALLGYTTLYGDSACALNPLGDLYKTQVWQLARWMDVPREIVDKAPSADLWTGQTDESELGFTYEQADTLLYYLVDERRSTEELAAMGFDSTLTERITRLIRQNQFKRVPPLIGKVGFRTINADFRYPRDWGL
jgi:NAD+ synthase